MSLRSNVGVAAVCLLALLPLLLRAQSTTTTTGTNTWGPEWKSGVFVGNSICRYYPRGLDSLEFKTVKRGEACDDVDIQIGSVVELADFHRSVRLSPDDDGHGAVSGFHPLHQQLMTLFATRRERGGSDRLMIRRCEQGSFCQAGLCVIGIASGSIGCQKNSDCLDYQHGYTSARCDSGRCQVDGVYGPGEAGCSNRRPVFDGDGCLDSNSCNENSHSCMTTPVGGTCSNAYACTAASAYCDMTQMQCKATVLEGQACSEYNQCGIGLVCGGSPAPTCQRLLSVAEGGSCATVGVSYQRRWDGYTGLGLGLCEPDLVCRDSSKTCQLPEKEGEPCNSDADCGIGTMCEQSIHDCERVCTSRSLRSILGSAANSLSDFIECLASNACMTAATWADNCAGLKCSSESRHYLKGLRKALFIQSGASKIAAPLLSALLAAAAFLVL